MNTTTQKTAAQKKAVREVKNLRTKGSETTRSHGCCRCCRCCRCG